jgi:hypothetical protein
LNNGPRKLGKNDSRKSKIIDLDDLKDLKDKAITIKDRNKDKITGKGRALVTGKGLDKGKPRSLGRPSNGKGLDKGKGKSLVTGKSLGKDKGNGLSPAKRKGLGKPPKDHPSILGKSDDRDELSLLSDELQKIPGIKDKRIVLGVLLIIFICVVGLLAINSFNTTHNATNNTTNITSPPVNHFENGLISFDYPEGWNVTNGTKAPVVVTVAKNENNSFVVMNEDLGNLTFQDRMSQWRENIMQTGAITYEGNITIDNSTGYNIEFAHKVNNTTFNARGVAVSKNTTIYFVMFIFDSSPLDYKDEMDLVINSFHIIH